MKVELAQEKSRLGLVRAALLPVAAGLAAGAVLMGPADMPWLGLLAASCVSSTLIAWRFVSRGASRIEAVDGALPALPVTPPVAAAVNRPEAHIAIDALAEPTLIVGADLVVIGANDAAEAKLGPTLGKDLPLVLRQPVVVDAVSEARRVHRPIERELRSLGRDEGVYKLRVAPLGDERVLLTFTDITLARLTERMRVDFVANASHELRTPLATLIGFIETLQGPAAGDREARSRFLDIMAGEAARMARLIDDLLSLSRIELDKFIRPQGVVYLQPLLSDVKQTLAMRLEGHERELVLDIEEGLPGVVGDRDQVLQVLHNLLSNSLKYGQQGTPIRVRAVRRDGRDRREGSLVELSVVDQGEGIAPEHLPRLTERFYRVDTSRSRSMGGTGLGLAIVKHIVERHRGELVIESQQGIGTKVVFTLPVAEGQAVAEPAVAQARMALS